MGSRTGSWMDESPEVSSGVCVRHGKLTCHRLLTFFSFSPYSGAWLALALWDHVSYTFDFNFIATRLLPIFEGIADFFMEYMFEVYGDEISLESDAGKFHNITSLFFGPSTSPENSFGLQDKALYVAFNPAIDLAILRQVANAYKLSVALIKDSFNVQKHHQKSLKFIDAVHRLPYDATPVITKSGIISEYPLPFSNFASSKPKRSRPRLLVLTSSLILMLKLILCLVSMKSLTLVIVIIRSLSGCIPVIFFLIEMDSRKGTKGTCTWPLFGRLNESFPDQVVKLRGQLRG